MQYLSSSGGSSLPVECVYEIQSRKESSIWLSVEKLKSGVKLEVRLIKILLCDNANIFSRNIISTCKRVVVVMKRNSKTHVKKALVVISIEQCLSTQGVPEFCKSVKMK